MSEINSHKSAQNYLTINNFYARNFLHNRELFVEKTSVIEEKEKNPEKKNSLKFYKHKIVSE